MKERVNRAKETIENSIKWAEEDLARERAQVLKIAKNGCADEIIAWAGNMKDTEARIHALKEQLKVVEYING